MKKIVYILFLISFLSRAGNPPSIIFKENKGQWPEKVLFGTEILNTKFYVNKNSFNYCIYNAEEYIKCFGRRKDEKPNVVHGHNYEVAFADADLSNTVKKNECPEYYNYFLGKDRTKWASNVKAYENVLFTEIYNGIDLKLYSNNINLKYDFIVKPNANINLIRLNFKYTDGAEIVNDELVIKTSVGNTIEKSPYAYQIINGIKNQVKCKYTLLDKNLIGFSFPEGYNKNYELVIDPVVVVCSYSGASCYAFGDCCSYDANGNIYVGAEADIGYPTTPGAFQLNNNTISTAGWGLIDMVISVYTNNGSAKLFSTYIGGDYGEYPADIMVKNNEIITYGVTESDNYPCTVNAFDTTFNDIYGEGEYDIVISKLNMSGTALLASTYVGGTNTDVVNTFNPSAYWWGWYSEMECDNSGNVYIVGATKSNDFPVTSGVISPTLQGVTDAYVFKINNTLSNLIWSTYLGGSLNESGTSIKCDGIGGVYCYGSTNSSNFPITPGAYNTIKNGTGTNADLYISHIDSTGTVLLASTFLGTSSQDYSALMNLDNNNNVYLTACLSVPSTFTASPGTFNNTGGYNCIYKLNTSLSVLSFKTKFGFPPPPVLPAPSPNLCVSAIKVDSCENIYIGGYAANVLPTTPNALQLYGGGPTDMYIAQFKQNCSSLAFASFFGGSVTTTWASSYSPGESTGLSDFDNKGYYYSAIGIPGGLPVTPNAYATTWVNTATISPCNDAFVKIDFQSHINATSSYGSNFMGCPPFTPTFVSTTNTGSTYWDLGNGVTSTNDTISTTYTVLGNYNVLLVVTDTNTCERTDSIKSILSVVNPTSFSIDDVPTCLNTVALVKSNISAITYSWSTGETTPNILALPGTYTLTINNGGCNSSSEVNVIVAEKKLAERFPNVITPNADGVNDFVDFTNYNFDEVEFILYDRWGRERYKIINPTEKWSPDDLDNGTYYYVINYKSACTGKHAQGKGFISVFK